MTPLTLMPVLSRGKHRTPAGGACFMEHTSLLAGEAFSDRPCCVDPALAAVLRGANDALSDEERPALVPLLGRAIGLVVTQPADGARHGGRFRRHSGRDRTAAVTARLHAMVAERFRGAVDESRATPGHRWYLRYAGVGQTFWDLMDEPSTPRTSREYSARLVQRLGLLHRCYEDALAAMELAVRPGPEPARTAAIHEPPVLAMPTS